MRFIRYKREKQQINFLNCNELDKWVDTCQTRPTEFYDVCEDCCTSSIIEPISYWKADNVLVCGSELGSDYLSDHSYEKWIEYNKYDHSIISIDYRNGVPSCDCGYADYEWKYGDRTICGYELGDGYDQTSIYQVWEYVNGCDPTDIQAIEYRNPQKSCECGYRTLTMRVSDPLETKCYEPTGDTDPSIGYTYVKYYQWSICPDDPSYDEKTGLEEWVLSGRTCECGWVQKAFVPTEEYYCGSEIGKTATTKYQKYLGVNLCPEDQSIIEYTGDYRYYSVEHNSCDCGYDDKEWVLVSTGCSGTSSYELWNYIDKCANTVISSETRNVVANDCNCGAVNLTDWTYIGQVCGIELGDDYDKTYIYDKYVRYDTCDNSVYATEYRNGTYNEECATSTLVGNIAFEFDTAQTSSVVWTLEYWPLDPLSGWSGSINLTASTSPYSISLREIGKGNFLRADFKANPYITKINELPIKSGFNVIYSLEGLFQNLTAVTEINTSNWDMSPITDTSYMFANCKSLTSLDTSGWDTRGVENVTKMFSGCSSLSSIDMSSWDLSNVEDLDYFTNMFGKCTSLKSVKLCNKFPEVKIGQSGDLTLEKMFSGCTNLEYIDASALDYTNFVESVESLFANLKTVKTIELGEMKNSSHIKNFGQMFYYCSGLTSIDLSNFDTSNATNMDAMFYGCSALTSLDLSSFDFTSITGVNSIDNMFEECNSLTTLDLSGWDLSNIRLSDITENPTKVLFAGCDSLKTIYMRGCDEYTVAIIEAFLSRSNIKDQVTIITT